MSPLATIATPTELLVDAGLELANVMPDPIVNTVAGAVGALGILGFALAHVMGRRRVRLIEPAAD